jgi:hypothetical protein
VKNRWKFRHQQERNRTFRQGRETARVPEKVDEDKSTIDWGAAPDGAFRACGVRITLPALAKRHFSIGSHLF